MTTILIAAMAAISGLGLAIAIAGIRGHALLEPGRLAGLKHRVETFGLGRIAWAATAAVVALGVTGWIAGALLAALAVLFGPKILGGNGERKASIDRTEAIASWTEMIRDSIAAASGLEEAITATGSVAPAPIRVEVRQLTGRLRHASLPDALAAFGEEVDHPSADMVVAALSIAARMEASDLTGLLSRLAESIRGDARMRVRVEVGRTRVRTATKVIIGVVGATVVLLTVLNRGYLAAYDSPGGQLALMVIGGVFALGGWLLVHMAGLDLPDRFTARRTTEPSR